MGTERMKQLGKIVAFVLTLAIVCTGVGAFFQPVWYEWSNEDRVRGFYAQPQNTIETIFLGSSTTVRGIIPMQLYRDFGMSTYNLATEQQPFLTSYYWLEEAYRLHKETLKYVIVDASMLRREPEIEFYQKSIDGMQFSTVKIDAVGAYTDYKVNDIISYISSLFSYHTRWMDIRKQDFTKFIDETNRASKGYDFNTTTYLDLVQEFALSMQVQSGILDPSEPARELSFESVEYFHKMSEFCREHDIQLKVIKVPVINWDSSYHNAVAELAKSEGVEFVDLNFEPYLIETGINYVADSNDFGHFNYYGAEKITEFIGNYLVENCQVTDVRGNEAYAFLEEDLKEYEKWVTIPIQFAEETDLVEYLTTAMSHDEYMVFMTAKDEAAGGLGQEVREQLETMGFAKLAELGYRNSYMAVIDGGTVCYEQSEEYAEEIVENRTQKYLQHSGTIDETVPYDIKSGGIQMGNVASCKIDGVEYAKDERGLNIVVYDKETHTVVDSSVFDTCVAPKKESANLVQALDDALQQGKTYETLSENLQKLYLYNQYCEITKLADDLEEQIGADGFLTFLNTYLNQENTVIYLSVFDEAAGSMGTEAREWLRGVGLQELANLGYRDSYLAIIDEGSVFVEKRASGTESVSFEFLDVSLTSGGAISNQASSIQIDGKEYSGWERGIHVVVYHKELDRVIDTAIFDTSAVPTKVA